MHQPFRHRLGGLLAALCAVVGGVVIVDTMNAQPASALVSGGTLLCDPDGIFANAAVIGVRGEPTAGDYAMIQWWWWSASEQQWRWFTSRSDFASGWHEWPYHQSQPEATFTATGSNVYFAATLWTYSWRTGYQSRLLPAVGPTAGGGGTYCLTR